MLDLVQRGILQTTGTNFKSDFFDESEEARTKVAIKLLGLVLGIALVFSASAANAEENRRKWARTDTVAEVVSLLPYVIDWGQTLHIANHEREYFADGSWENCEETNPILGRKPSRGRVNIYFATSIAGHFLISRLLPNPYRRIWQAVTFGYEVGMVVKNDAIGIRIEF